MRRLTSIVALSLMLIVMVGSAVSASGETFSATGGTGPEGGTLPVSVTVHQAAPGTTFSALVVVHFATGDARVTITSDGAQATAQTTDRRGEHGRGHHHQPPWPPRHHRHPKPQPGTDLTATAQLPIPGEEPFGTVSIDVTITYGAQVVIVSTTGLIDGY